MARQITASEYQDFVREKRAAAIHFDAEWDASYRCITRLRMQEAEEALSNRANFAEVHVDRDIPLAKSVHLLGVPAVAYYRDGSLVAVLSGVRQNVRERVERILGGETVGNNDGLDGR
jgi:thioredoxin-like negative regulator of GroEL